MEDPEGSRPVELHAGVNLIRSFLWRKYWNISLWDGEDELEIRVPYTLNSETMQCLMNGQGEPWQPMAMGSCRQSTHIRCNTTLR